LKIIISPIIRTLTGALRPKMIAALLCPILVTACGAGGGSHNSAGTAPPNTVPSPPATAVTRILFVGDSFTHGRYAPVRQYNSGGTLDPVSGSSLVYDENYGQTGARAELEQGPWGGIPGIFAELASEENLNFDIHIEAISETSLAKNYEAASSVIDQAKWNDVVLQEISAKPLPASVSLSSVSDPRGFCSSVATIENGIHQAAPSAGVYLYETWPTADTADALTAKSANPGSEETYLSNLSLVGDDIHDAYFSAAAHDGRIAGVAPAGDAWQRAWDEGIANPDPESISSLPLLWYNINATNDPAINKPDLHHPSVYGAYLSGLVLFQKMTGIDVRNLGAAEKVAQQLGVPSASAVALQRVAWEAVTHESPARTNDTVDACNRN